MFKFPSLKRKRRAAENGEHEHKPSRLPRMRWIVLFLCIAASLAFNGILYKRLFTTRNVLKAVEQQKQEAMVDIVEPLDERSQSPAGVWYGLCPKNSIHSIADFKATVAIDPLLTKHFSDFQWDKARMGKLDHKVRAHLAYRKNGTIRTTRRIISLPRGDGYITDGDRWVRTYCCNDYVSVDGIDKVEGPENPYDMIDDDLNRLAERADDSSRAAKLSAAKMFYDYNYMAVPEPATLLLTGAGFSLFGIFMRKGRQRKNN